MRVRRATAAALALLALAFAGCGGDDDEETTASTPAETPAAEAPSDQPTEPETDKAEGGDLKDTSTKPAIEKPSGDPPSKLEVEDIVEGDGPVAKSGATVEVHYVGVSFSTGQEFDASWDRGAPFSFPLGQGMVIPGWDEGVEGMRVGGRRRLVIPPDLAYGEQGSPPAIGPDETLVFIVDLLGVE